MTVIDLPRRWRWAIAALCGLVVLLVVFVIAARGGDRPDGARPATAARPQDGAGASIAPKAHEASVGAPTRSPPADPHADEVQVCGGAWVKTQGDGSIDQGDLIRATNEPDARKRVVAALRAEPSELAHAVALWFEMRGTGDEKWRLVMDGASGCDSAECRNRQQAVPEVGEARDALARMAVSSTDPSVYALAFHTCGVNREGACQMLNAEQWARLDPGNATPWLFMLSAAKTLNDLAAQNEALHRIATAQRSETGVFTIPGLVASAVPSDETSMLAAWTMAAEAFGMEAAFTIPGYQPLVADCNSAALRDSNRRQTCAAIADVLVARSDTLMERMIGVVIGGHVGWSAERSDQLRGEFHAYSEHAGAPTLPDEGGTGVGCADVRRGLDLFRRLAIGGEAGEMRAWVERSGRTPEDFVSVERARQKAEQALRARAQADAASAAAGGAPASRP